jgi:hypothetical protein
MRLFMSISVCGFVVLELQQLLSYLPSLSRNHPGFIDESRYGWGCIEKVRNECFKLAMKASSRIYGL